MVLLLKQFSFDFDSINSEGNRFGLRYPKILAT